MSSSLSPGTTVSTPSESRTETRRRPRRGGRRCVYGEAVTEGLVVLWEASDRVCGKRLKALLPILVPALERHGHLCLDPGVRERLMAVSAATIDRRLEPARAVTAGQRRRRRSRLDGVRGSVPVRTFGDWQDPAPGFVKADLVAHCGGSMSGSFVWTLVLTDIASGWTECVPLLVREAHLVVDAVDQLRGALPFPLRGIDTDNGSEFLNEVLIGFCKEHGIEFTRSRPFRKNDQAWVEQKNGAVVRRLVGYGRLEGMPGADALARLYSAARLFVNVFQPSFKLAEKTRVGARVHKRYHAPETPCARLLASDRIPAAMKDRLRALLGTLGSARAVGRDPRGSTSPGRPGRRCDGPSDAATRCRPRRVSTKSGAGLARRRGAADAPGRPWRTLTWIMDTPACAGERHASRHAATPPRADRSGDQGRSCPPGVGQHDELAHDGARRVEPADLRTGPEADDRTLTRERHRLACGSPSRPPGRRPGGVTLGFSDRCLGEKLAVRPPRSGSNGSPPRTGIAEPPPRPAAHDELAHDGARRVEPADLRTGPEADDRTLTRERHRLACGSPSRPPGRRPGGVTLGFSDRYPPPDGAGDLRRRALGEKLAIRPPRSGSNGSPPRAGITEQSPRPRPAALNEAPALPSAGLAREGARPAKLAGRPGPCHGSEHGRARHGPVDAAAAVDAQTRPPLLGPSADGWPTAPTGTLLVPQSLTASAGNAVRSF